MRRRTMGLMMAVAALAGVAVSACGGQDSGKVGSAMTPEGTATGSAGERRVVLNKQKVESIGSIPDGAEVIFHATWAGTKTKEGFSSNELYVADSEGKEITQVTHNGYAYNHFAVSPNRKLVAASRFDRGDTNGDGKLDYRDFKALWIIDTENKEEWPLLSELNAAWGGVVWSPDGDYLYFSALTGVQLDLVRVRPDGMGFENLTAGRGGVFAKQGRQMTDLGISKDGKWLAFLYLDPAVKRSVIAVCRTDGTDSRIVTDGGELAPGQYGIYGAGDYDPEFSPDGQYIVFHRATPAAINPNGMTSDDVMTVKLDGTGLKRLSPEGNKAIHGVPDWSEGGRIVFSEWNMQENWMGPVIVNPDGSDYHRVEALRGGTYVRWIPD